MNGLSKYICPVGKYAFHRTQVENVESIKKHGVQHERAIKDDTLAIQNALVHFGYEDRFPFDRSTVTYCYIDGEYVRDLHADPFGALSREEVTVVVAVDEIPAPMYLADMSAITTLIKLHSVGSHRAPYYQSPEDVVRQYRESIIQVESAADIRSDQVEGKHTELVVNGEIPTSAIVDVLPA